MTTTQLIEFEKKDDVLIARYLTEKPITREVAEQLVNERKAFMSNEPTKLVVVFPKITSMDKGGRDYLSTAEAKEGILASAMVTNSVLGRVIVNFFLKLNNNDKDDIPNKVFNNEQDALNWLKDLE